jgi:glutamate carboxypeptidase
MAARAAQIAEWLAGREGEMIALLERLVNQDSGTYDRDGVNRVADLMAMAYQAIGFSVQRVPNDAYADHLVATRGDGPGRRRLLCVGHMDTVFPAGTAATRPFRIQAGRATGPGVVDMKGGLTVLRFALAALAATESPAIHQAGITVLMNADEEIGSPSSRALIDEAARRHDAAIVLEPARPNGECVIARKGVGHFRVEVFGKQAHAGSQPELGVNAIWELAHKICALQALNDPVRGSTVNVGVVRGGERSNVVPDYACADIDLRVWNLAEAERITRAFREITGRTSVAGARGQLTGEVSTPPWSTDDGTRRMHQILQRAAAHLGLQIPGVETGGGSDGSRTAQHIPTLDGLGPIGSKMHSPEEYLEVSSLTQRAALVALFVEEWLAASGGGGAQARGGA